MAQHDYWKSEIVRIEAGGEPIDPHRQERTNTDDICGYWRVLAAKTKNDWPVIIHRREGEEAYTVQWGAGRPRPFNDGEEQEFRDGTFLKCRAVRRLEFEAAVQRGEWADDGKRALPQSTEEKHDVIPDTPAEQGGNMQLGGEAPVGEDGEPIDTYWEQVKAKIEKAVADAKALGTIDSQEKAEQAAKIRDTIKELGSMGEKRRKEEKEPWDEGARKVQAKYVPTLQPASQVALDLLTAIDRWQRAEKRRLEAEAEAARQAEVKRLADIEADRLKKEAEEEAARRAAAGEAPVDAPSEAEIQQRAAAAAEETVPEVEVAKPTVQGSRFSRATTKARKKTGKIIDADKFIAAIKDQEFFTTFLQEQADRLARANMAIDGMEIDNGD